MTWVDLVRVGIIKNFPSSTWGAAGGAQPPAPCKTNVGVLVVNFNENLWRIQSIILNLATYTPTFQYPSTITKISQKLTKTQKNTKIVRMTSYSQVSLPKELAAQKYRVSIFRTNEGDFSCTPVKNQ